MLTQYNVFSYRNDLYLHDYKLAIEIDEMDTVTEILTTKHEKTKSNRTRTWL